MMKTITSVLAIFVICNTSFSQQMWRLGGNTDGGPPANQGLLSQSNYFGATETANVRLGTGNISRMFISGTSAPNPGYIGIGPNFTSPLAPLHIRGSGTATSQGWRRALLISGHGSIVFDNAAAGAQNHFFMAHPSASPVGDFYMGLASGFGASAPVDYTQKIYGQNNPGAPAQGVTRFFHTVLGDERVGVNMLFPHRRIDATDNALPQLRLTHTTNENTALGIFTDFQATSAGNLYINPRINGSLRNVGIGVFTPTERLDVNGNGRFRTLPNASNELPGAQKIVVVDEASGNNGVLRWMDINDLGGGAADADWFASNNIGNPPAAIGDNIYTFGSAAIGLTQPQNKLHLHQVSPPFSRPVNVMLQYTHDGTGSTATDGFITGISGNGDAVLNNREQNNHMRFFTEDTERARITAAGNFGINTFGPTERFDVDGNGRFRTLPDASNELAGAQKIVVVDETSGNNGVLRWMDINDLGGGGGGGADNDWHDPNTGAAPVSINDPAYRPEWTGIGTSAVSTNGLLEVEAPSGSATFYQSAGRFTNISAVGHIGIPIYGVWGRAVDAGIAHNIGGFFEASGSSVSNTGIMATGTDYAGWFNGDVYVDGNITATGSISDSTLKTNIQNLTNVNDIISQLNPKSFYFDTVNFPQLNFDSKLKYGLLAQEVESILPEIIFEGYKSEVKDSNGVVIHPAVSYKGLRYKQFIPILIEAIKEQQSTIDSMQTYNDSLETELQTINNRLDDIETCLSNLPTGLGCEDNARTGNENNDATHKWDELAQTVELNDARTIILHQNDPNPFAEQTVIRYEIPETVRDARIIFHNMGGVVIKEVRIDTRGQEGRLQVYASDLSTGVYTYSIIADGELVDTRKMVKR